VNLRLSFRIPLALAAFVLACSLSASLEEILAPLPLVQVASTPSEVPRPPEPPSQEPPAPSELAKPAEPAALAAPIHASDQHAALLKALEESLHPSGELTLIPLRDFPDLSGYEQPFRLNLVQIPGRLTRGNILLSYQVENQKGILGEWSIPFRVHLFSEVWFPRSRLRRGDIASPSDFDVREIDLLVEPDAVPAALENLLRHEYSRDIVPGRSLVWRDLAQRALVRKGDLVEVTAVNGLLAITMRAIARQDGSSGELILLRNLDSSKEFSARVVAENRAEVVF